MNEPISNKDAVLCIVMLPILWLCVCVGFFCQTLVVGFVAGQQFCIEASERAANRRKTNQGAKSSGNSQSTDKAVQTETDSLPVKEKMEQFD